MREQLIKRLAGSSEGSEQFAKSYEDLMKKYSQLSEGQIQSENAKRSLINSYEDKLRDLNKELLGLRRDHEGLQAKS